jgi:sarcosine oxidase subunit gamma
MTDPVSALGNAQYDGFATIREVGPIGMISLRTKPGTLALAKAIKAAVGTASPAQMQIVGDEKRAAGWMSVDETLLILPYDETAAAMTAISKALSGEPHLAAVVSDARAVFDVTGKKADQVLRKLCPVDLDRMEKGELKRTRAAQVAAAFWAIEGGYRVVCFRSVAAYMMGLLAQSSKPGSELF